MVGASVILVPACGAEFALPLAGFVLVLSRATCGQHATSAALPRRAWLDYDDDSALTVGGGVHILSNIN
jgi:hypothetical protein